MPGLMVAEMVTDPDVRPLGGGRLDRPQVVQEGVDVLDQLRLAEVQLADRGGDVAPLVVAELDLARLELADAPRRCRS